MPDQVESFKLICGGGLNSNENHLDLSDNNPGSATRLINYEPSLFGGYRRINGYEELGYTGSGGLGEVGTSSTSEGPVLGLAIYQNSQYNNPFYIAARADTGGSTYSFYKYVPLVGWQSITTGFTRNMTSGLRSVNRLRHVQFNYGGGDAICFVDGVNPAIVFDGNTWYELLTTNTGGTASAGGPFALDAPSLVNFFKNTLFLAGDDATKPTVAYSKPVTTIDPHGYLDFGTGNGGGQLSAGFPVVQIKPFRDNLFIFGSNAINKASADTTVGFTVDPVTANVGCVATDSVLEIGGDLIFLSPDGFRPVAGTSRIGDVEIESVSRPIQGALVDIIANYDLDTLCGVVIRSKSQIRYFVGDETEDKIAAYGLIGGLTEENGRIRWNFGELVGIRAHVAASDYVGSTEVVLHGDYDGKVYQQEKGNNFSGDDILAVYSTPYLDFGDTDIRKVFREINTFVRAEGPFELSLSLRFDWGDYDTSSPSSYTQDSRGGPVEYSGRNIDYAGTNVLYGGNSKPIMSTDVQGSGFSVRAEFVSIGQFDPYSVQGLVFEYSVAGRR
jgi:hypothetical protein